MPRYRYETTITHSGSVEADNREEAIAEAERATLKQAYYGEFPPVTYDTELREDTNQ